jgi:rhamnogalacturonyl hydrolase YesR
MQRHSWEQGVALEAFISQGETEIAVLLAKEAVYRKREDGRVAEIGVMNGVTDPCSLGPGLLYAYEKTKDPDFKDACDGLLLWALEKAPRNDEGIIYHLSDGDVFWVDSMYMLPPFLASTGHFDEALIQIRGYVKKLMSSDRKLFYHQWNEGNKCYDRKKFWGVGNGWAIAGLARVIDLLPKEYACDREELIVLTLEVIESISNLLREDGFTHDMLDDETTFVDTNLPQLLSYTIYRGIRNGWIPKSWKKVANHCRKAVNSKVDNYGLVQDGCGAPRFDSPGVSPEGQAFYLLMESEAELINC